MAGRGTARFEVSPADLEGLQAAGAALLGPLYQVGARRLDAPPPDLPLAEASAIEGAVDKRRREFAHGRALSRSLLERLGCRQPVIPRLADRSPGWPSGFAGTLSHTDEAVIAAVALDDGTGCGLDLEPEGELDSSLVELLLHPDEPPPPPELSKVLFSAKEAFYKAQYRHTKTLLDFKQVRLLMNPAEQRFEVVAIESPCRAHLPTRMQGGWRRTGPFLLTSCLVPAR